MKKFLTRTLALIALAALPSALLAAEELQWIVPDEQDQVVQVQGQENVLISYSENEVAPVAQCPTCNQDPCNGCRCGAGCDDCPRRGLQIFTGLDTFRGIGETDWESNFGAVAGFNSAFAIPRLSDYGLAWQFGASMGVYDFEGRDSGAGKYSASQTQTYITTGFFRKANECQRISFGMVYDWSINSNWGEESIEPFLGQWRGQIEYALNQCNAIGFMGTYHDRGDSQAVQGLITDYTARTRSLNQVSFFFHHKFESGADGRIWFGVPDRKSVTGHGSLGEWLAGASLEVPLSQRVALYTSAQYMKPSAGAGMRGGPEEDAYDLAVGLAFYPFRNARSNSLNGGCYMPYMPMANNSNFLIEEARY